MDITEERLRELAAREQKELERRVSYYRGDRELPDLRGRDVVLVDDGLATGVTAEAALSALRDRQPRRLVLAVPVCAVETSQRLGALADVICLISPSDFRAVGLWYDRFDQTTDDTVIELLDRLHPPPLREVRGDGSRGAVQPRRSTPATQGGWFHERLMTTITRGEADDAPR